MRHSHREHESDHRDHEHGPSRHHRHRGHGRHGMGEHHHDESRLRLRRLFKHGDLRFVLLQMIAEKPRHGYDLIKAIEEKVSGAYSPSPGIIYPTLTMLEEQGYVTVSSADGTKKLYTITAEGKAFADENRPAIDSIFAKIDELGASQSPRPPQVVRAMESLRFALRLRLSRGTLDDEQARAIAAALDSATTAIERT